MNKVDSNNKYNDLKNFAVNGNFDKTKHILSYLSKQAFATQLAIINFKDENGNNLLHQIMMNIDSNNNNDAVFGEDIQNYCKIVELLLDTQRIDVNAVNTDKMTSLWLAIEKDLYDLVHVICGNCKEIELDLFHKRHASLNMNYFEYCVNFNKLDILKELILAVLNMFDLDVDAYYGRDWTKPVTNDKLLLVELLRYLYVYSKQLLTTKNDCTQFLKSLLNSRHRLEQIVESNNGWNICHYLAVNDNINKWHLTFYKLLLSNCNNIEVEMRLNTFDFSGNLPIHIAGRCNNYKFLDILLNQRIYKIEAANLNEKTEISGGSKNEFRKTLLMIVIEEHNFECLQILCEKYWNKIDIINIKTQIDVKKSKFNALEQSVIYNIDDARFTMSLLAVLFKQTMMQYNNSLKDIKSVISVELIESLINLVKMVLNVESEYALNRVNIMLHKLVNMLKSDDLRQLKNIFMDKAWDCDEKYEISELNSFDALEMAVMSEELVLVCDRLHPLITKPEIDEKGSSVTSGKIGAKSDTFDNIKGNICVLCKRKCDSQLKDAYNNLPTSFNYWCVSCHTVICGECAVAVSLNHLLVGKESSDAFAQIMKLFMSNERIIKQVCVFVFVLFI